MSRLSKAFELDTPSRNHPPSRDAETRDRDNRERQWESMSMEVGRRVRLRMEGSMRDREGGRKSHRKKIIGARERINAGVQ